MDALEITTAGASGVLGVAVTIAVLKADQARTKEDIKDLRSQIKDANKSIHDFKTEIREAFHRNGGKRQEEMTDYIREITEVKSRISRIEDRKP